MNIRLRENVDWVGYVDWNVRDFHSFDTTRGSTYNAYLVRDEKTALIDTVKEPFAEDLLRKIAAVCDPAQVDYVVCNHAEPDHAGGLPQVMRAMPGATLVCNKKCAAALAEHHDTSSWKVQTVDDGETLSLGNRTLQFINTPMVHWPESMFTYIAEEKLLFSMDAFGQHYATCQRFDDEVPLCSLMEEAKTYYANIVMPFGKQVAAVLKKAAGLEIDVIAPSHGIIWRRHIPEILAAYDNWAAYRMKPKVLVLYDAMWESTAKMARAILDGSSREGVSAELIHVRRSNLTRIATEMLDAAAVAVGSPTMNRGMMPMMAAVLTYLKGLKPPGKAGFAFGSFGWGRGGPEEVDRWLREIGWEVLREPLRSKYRPDAAVLDECRAAGKLLAEKAEQLAGDRTAGKKVCVDP